MLSQIIGFLGDAENLWPGVHFSLWTGFCKSPSFEESKHLPKVGKLIYSGHKDSKGRFQENRCWETILMKISNEKCWSSSVVQKAFLNG